MAHRPHHHRAAVRAGGGVDGGEPTATSVDVSPESPLDVPQCSTGATWLWRPELGGESFRQGLLQVSPQPWWLQDTRRG